MTDAQKKVGKPKKEDDGEEGEKEKKTADTP